MSFFKKTLFWVIVLIALAGGFFFFDEKQQTLKEAKEADLKLLPHSAKEVSAFWIGASEGRQRIEAKRLAEGWQITQPLATKGDDKVIDKFLGNVVGARKDAVLFTAAEHGKLAELGFGANELEMGIQSSGGETVIVFGEKGPTLNVAYVMFKGRPEVYRVHADLRKEAAKELLALRDKTILEFDPVKMQRLEILRRDGPKVVIEQDRGRWNMLAPVAGRASMSKVLELLYAIRNGEIKAFADEDPGDLTPYGLAAPRLQVVIRQEQKDSPFILTIGERDRPRRGYFARTNLMKKVFDVDEELVNAILLGADQLAETETGK